MRDPATRIWVRAAVTAAVCCAALLPAASQADARSRTGSELVDCALTGTAHFSPPLSGTARPTTVTVDAALSPCTYTVFAPDGITSGTAKVTLVFSALSCTTSTLDSSASHARFNWNLADGDHTFSRLTGITLTQAIGNGILAGTVTADSPRLAGERAVSVLEVISKQLLTSNCETGGTPVADSTVVADIAFA
ncbi:hypothetical protein [Kitasatospora sp. NPDC093806]|uniref:hypothetical protein n=1 Tax=Kitasatospora sp. NPDC093806 TaxID=3155075 RepID=UPI003437CD46